jgi:ribonuclease HI
VVILEGATRTEICEPLGQGTNNIAELTAIERVLDTISDTGRPLVIYTDSEYAVGVLSKGWKAKANLALVERVRERLAKRPATRLVHVRGHAGIELNERADELAREAVKTGRARTERSG